MDKTPQKSKKYLHAGHRSRMRRRFLRDGLDSFADHEVLELLLFYAMPRQDVNPMAHALLEKFGSLPEVLDAPVEALCTVHGVGPKVARFLTLIPDVLFQTEYCLLSPSRTSLRSPADFAALMNQRCTRPSPGDAFVIPLNGHYAAQAVYPYATFDELDVREVALRTLHIGSKLVVLAECVDDPTSIPSEARVDALIYLQRNLAALDIRFVDYYRFDPACAIPQSAASVGLLLPR